MYYIQGYKACNITNVHINGLVCTAVLHDPLDQPVIKAITDTSGAKLVNGNNRAFTSITSGIQLEPAGLRFNVAENIIH